MLLRVDPPRECFIERRPELADALLARAAAAGLPVFFLGAAEGVAARAAGRAREHHPELLVAGAHHGYFSADEELSVVEAVRRSGAAVLLAASIDVFRRQCALFTATIALGAAALVAGTVLRALDAPRPVVLPAWIAFLVLTIAGERLELARFLPPSPRAAKVFAAIVVALIVGTLAAHARCGSPTSDRDPG